MGALPGLLKLADSLEKTSRNATKFAGIMSASDDASPALYSLAEGFSGAIDVFGHLSEANSNLAEAIDAKTDQFLFSLNWIWAV